MIICFFIFVWIKSIPDPGKSSGSNRIRILNLERRTMHVCVNQIYSFYFYFLIDIRLPYGNRLPACYYCKYIYSIYVGCALCRLPVRATSSGCRSRRRPGAKQTGQRVYVRQRNKLYSPPPHPHFPSPSFTSNPPQDKTCR